ncbi:MAG: hypothetical protein ACHQ6U_05190 [Thermodesulfobacteriota bacterium]
MPDNVTKRVLILGGGFAGLGVAQNLEKIFKQRDDVEITLVSRNNYLVFTSMLAEVVSSSIEAKNAVIPLRECLRKSDFKELIGIAVQTISSLRLPKFWYGSPSSPGFFQNLIIIYVTAITIMPRINNDMPIV